MKTLVLKPYWFALLFFTVLVMYVQVSRAENGRAEKMDVETHSAVIGKLERVLPRMEKTNPSRVPTLLRLGDLYAERARLVAMQEVEKDCAPRCNQSFKDREKALAHYSQAFSQTKAEQKARLTFQMAHLFEITNQSPKALKLYQNLVSQGAKIYGPTALARAHASLGDLHYRKAQFEKAQTHFRAALKIPQLEKKGYALYRLAWCELNLGSLKQGISSLTQILTHPEYMEIRTSEGVQHDSSFQEDVARDLATFYARGKVTAQKLNRLAELTPENSRKANFIYLAQELDRLGQKTSALLVWSKVIELQPDHFERLETTVRVAQLHFELDHKQEAVRGLKSSIEQWQANGCHKQAECELLQTRLKKIVLDWYKDEKKKPSPALVDVFSAYLAFFKADIDMNYSAALAAREQKAYREAIVFYHTTSLLAYNALNSKPAPVEMNRKRYQAIFEDSLLAETEVAEMLKDKALRESAYIHFLKLNPNSPKATEVRYQLAHVRYETGRYNESAEEFKAIALYKSEQTTLRKQAADLALDSLAILKDSPRIETWSKEFAQVFPSAQKEFYGISRKSVLHQAQDTVSKQNTSRSDYEEALEKLARAEVKGATHAERLQLYKTQNSLAQKAQNIPVAMAAVNSILALPELTEREREAALAEKVWLAEMKLDFTTAYAVSLKMRHKNLSPAKRQLRLAMLSELAGQNPVRHYNEYLRTSSNRTEANLVRAKLVRVSKNPAREFRRFQQDLLRSPQIYAPLALEVFAQTRDSRIAQEALKNRAVARSSSGQVLARHLFLKEFDKIARQARTNRLYSSSDAVLKRSLVKRIQGVKYVEGWAKKAVSRGDWTLQLITLDTVASETKRLYEEIMSLPVPRALKGKQKDQYRDLLEAHANPFLNRSVLVKSKVEEFWNNSQALESIKSEYLAATPETRELLAEEIARLSKIAPSSVVRNIGRVLNHSGPSRDDLRSARQDLQQDPFNIRYTEKLKTLEQEAGRDVMVAYLDERLMKLNGSNKGVRQ